MDVVNRAFYKLSQGLSHGADQDGRLLIAAMAGVYLLVVSGGRAIFSFDLWPHLGVPVGPSLFFDGRNVAAAAECRDLGFNPLVHNPCDPWGRPMVYPRVWLALRWLGLEESHTIALGVVAGALFLGALMLLLARLTVGEGVVAGLAACSPATMFAIERANMELVVFGITASAVVAWRFRPSSSVSPVLVLCAAIAKLYPVFGLFAFLWGRGRKTLLVGIGCLAVFLLYVVITLPDIQAIAAAAPQGEYYSYGARILVARLYHVFIPEGIGSGVVKQLVAAVPLALGAVALWIAARRQAPPFSIRQAVSAPLLAFHLGVFIYVGSFLSSNNFDYRLIYLFLTFPQLFEWVMGAHNADLRSKLAGVALVVVVVEMWVSALSEQIFLADEALSWALAGLLITLFALSTPPVSSIWRSLLGRAERPSTESPVPAADG